MAKKILCSTGTIVGRANGFDYRLITKYKDAIDADGFELMMLSAFYDQLPAVARELERGGVSVETIHFEKDITSLLGLGGEEDRREGLRRFTQNAEMGKAVGAKTAVFHLWDGRFSAERVEGGIALLETLYGICDQNAIELLVENVPCKKSPYALVCEVAARYPNASFTFDTRHAHFMKECDVFLQSPLWQSKIAHIHVSDHAGRTAEGMWGVTRPILHPGEGLIDFDALFAAMPHNDGETVTLESPVMLPDGTHDIEKLNRSLSFLRLKTKNL